MAGGLLNLVSEGQQNIILNGNPSKTFWKATYAKYTNWGKQNFRLDYTGTPTLNLTSESTFNFTVKRYADLLMDCYLSINLPNIWSPIIPPQTIINQDGTITYTDWAPYEFKWIDNIGAQMISKITITCGNQKLQEYSGKYLLSAVQRDFDSQKLQLFNQMSGNTADLNDPANYGSRVNAYPNAFYTTSAAGAQPSIMGKTLYVPLNSWFSMKTQMAFPLVSLQYNELQISVTIRPICELFRIRDVMDVTNNYPYVAPNFNQYYMQFYRFLQTPPDEILGPNSYIDMRTNWNADINLNCTYSFLSNDESRLFAKNEQTYLFRQVHEKVFYNVTGQNKVNLDSIGMIANWMFYFQRSDVNLRNEWSNYTNWPYNYMPQDVTPAPTEGNYPNPNPAPPPLIPATIGPGVNPYGNLSGLMTTGVYNPQNLKDILVAMGILLDGQYRENMLPAGVYNYVEKYLRTAGYAPDGLYCYNFSLDTSPFNMQPSGAMNMSRFTNIQFEFTTISPPVDPYAQVLTICDPTTGDLIGINKPTWRIYDYNFDLWVFEERINMVVFVGGNAGLMYAT
uniref:Major capsid protein N-terminal domain-containing protein n=1 Tax=viral metagenome TaxID=1070528 RepID=A0A6C0EQ07_9ZZZZ